MADAHSKAEIKILIVDDEVIIAEDLKQRLTGLGYTVTGTAVSAAKAFEAIGRERPDLILMDIVLAGETDGIEAAETVREEFDLPVVFITAYADQGRLERAKLILPFGYILKPFQDRDLRIAVEMALYVAKADSRRRRAEDELRQSEERFKHFMNQLPGVAWMKDSNGRTLFANDMYYRTSGLTPEQVDGQSYHEYLPPDVAEAFQAEDDEILSGGQSKLLEHTYHGPGGETHWLTNKFPVFQKDRPPLIGGISIDITDRRQAEDALAESEAKYRRLYEESSDGVLLADDRTVILEANPAMAAMLGYTTDELAGMTLLDIIDPDDLERQPMVLSSVMEGRTHHFKRRSVRRDGTTAMLDVSARLIKPGLIQSLYRDITDREQAEQAVRESEERLRYIIKHDPSAIAVLDRKMRYLFVSDRFLKDYNVKEENIIGRNQYEIFPEVPDRWREVHAQALAGRVLRSEDDSFVRLDGSVNHNRWECRPWYDARGEVGGIVLYTEVITERKIAEAALRESEKKWRTLAANLPDFIVIVDEQGLILETNRTRPEDSLDQVQGHSVFDFVRAENQGEYRRLLDQALQTNKLVILEAADIFGASYLVRVAPIEGDNDPPRALVIATDTSTQE